VLRRDAVVVNGHFDKGLSSRVSRETPLLSFGIFALVMIERDDIKRVFSMNSL
jgi:hypothetical protein